MTKRPAEIEKWHWEDYNTVDSTNNLAKMRSSSFDGKPVVFTAVAQTAGRGRLGRSWVSQPGNLFMSQLFCPRLPVSDLVFIASVSVAETAAELAPDLDIAIKWPNDVLVSGGKICGILIETADNESVVIGIGVNLTSSPPSTETVYPTSDFKSLKIEIDRETFLRVYLRHFNDNFWQCREQGFAVIRKTWLKYAANLGKAISVSLGRERRTGIFKGIDEKGFLLLEQEEKIIRIAAGDVFI